MVKCCAVYPLTYSTLEVQYCHHNYFRLYIKTITTQHSAELPYPWGYLSSSLSTVWSTYSNTRCNLFFLLNTSIRFTRFGCFSCCKHKKIMLAMDKPFMWLGKIVVMIGLRVVNLYCSMRLLLMNKRNNDRKSQGVKKINASYMIRSSQQNLTEKLSGLNCSDTW